MVRRLASGLSGVRSERPSSHCSSKHSARRVRPDVPDRTRGSAPNVGAASGDLFGLVLWCSLVILGYQCRRGKKSSSNSESASISMITILSDTKTRGKILPARRLSINESKTFRYERCAREHHGLRNIFPDSRWNKNRIVSHAGPAGPALRRKCRSIQRSGSANRIGRMS